MATDPTAYMPTKMAAAKPPVTNLTAEDITFCMPLPLFVAQAYYDHKRDEWGLNAAANVWQPISQSYRQLCTAVHKGMFVDASVRSILAGGMVFTFQPRR